MNILITGSNGQLGSQLKKTSKLFRSNKYTFVNEYEVNITNQTSIEKIIKSDDIDCIINCASYTNVDQAENDADNAMNVNGYGTKCLASAAANTNTYLVHYSTDYVFDGNNNKPYTEDDTPNPVTIYGKSKLEGEKEFFANGSKGLIIRTSWLYSQFGKNFVKTILEKGKEKTTLKVVFDQVGSPTNASDLAYATLKILQKAIKSSKKIEIYNYSNEGVASWYDIAIAITNIRKLPCKTEPVSSEEFPTVAHRPHYSLLDKSKIKNDFGITIPHWRSSLKECLKKYIQNS